MAYNLKQEECGKIAPIINSLDYHLSLSSIAEGLTLAGIFVDDTVNPETAFVWYKAKAWLLGKSYKKDYNRSLIKKLKKVYFKELIDKGIEGFRLHYSPYWEENIDEIFRNQEKKKYQRLFYYLEANIKELRLEMPDEYSLISIDEDLLKRNHLSNLNLLIEEMQSERSTADDFLEKSLGLCIIINNQIVSWCLSEYNVGNRCELGIATVEDYRNHELATLVAKALIQRLVHNDINHIGWHCSRNNQASIATARKLGFVKEEEYEVYWIHVK